MLSSLQRRWKAGLEAPLIEDMIGNAFSDFAPYAGADQQQLRLVRHQTDGTTSTLIYEENGDWSVNLGNPRIGSVAFATTRNIVFDLRARIPLLWRQGSGDNKSGTDTNACSGSTKPNALPARRRFDSAALLRPRCPHGAFGVLELLFSPLSERYGVGLRLGHFSFRLTGSPRASTALESPNSTQMSAFNRAPILIDGSWSTLLCNVVPKSLLTGMPASCRLSAALQHPMGSAEGDTLAALSLHSDSDEHGGDSFRILIVQTLMATGNASNAMDDTVKSRSTLFMGGTSWRELGTLFGVNKSFGGGLLRVSASSMVHDRDVDYEAAAVLDATTFFTNPTLLKVGINKVGRLGMAVSTKILHDLTVTLGVHHIHRTETCFGLEIAM